MTIRNNLKLALKNSAIYSLGPLSSKVVGFILLPLYTSHLTISEYGVLGIVDVTLQIFVSLFGLGLNWAFNRWYWDKEYVDKQKIIFFTLFAFLSLSSLFAVVVFLPFTQKASNILFDSARYAYLLKLMLIASALQIVSRLPNTLLKLQQRPVLFSVTNSVKLVFSLSFTIVFIVYLGRGINGIYEALIIANVVYFIFLSKYILQNMEWKFDWPLLREMLIFSLPLVGSSTATIVLNFADRYILKFIGGLGDVGVYSLGYKLSNTIKVFIIQSVILAVSPIIYKVMYDENSGLFYSRLMTYFGLGLMITVLGISMLGKELVMLLAKDKAYWDAYTIIPILSFAMFFIGLRYIAEIGLNIEKKTAVKAKIVVVVSLISIILNIIFIPLFQSIGASIAMLITQILFFYLNYRASQTHHPIPYEMTRFWKMLLPGLVIILIYMYVNQFSSTLILVLKIGLFVFYPIFLYIIKFYHANELDEMKQFLKR